MSGYVIGVDAGGTYTSAAAYSQSGEVLGVAREGFGNPLVDKQAAVSNIARAALGCRQQGECLLVMVGVAGGEGSQIAAALPYEIAAALKAGGLDAKVRVVSDGRMGLLAHFGGSDGVLVVAGTGSIVYGQAGGQLARSGGWGHLLGDEGSGYAIAREAVRLLLLRADQGAANTPFLSALYADMGTEKARDCVDVFHKQTKGENAALAKIVDAFAREGDCDAQTILRGQARLLAETVFSLHTRLGLPHSFRFAMVGGVIQNAYRVREDMERRLSELGAMPIAVESVPPTYAAARSIEAE